MEASKRAVRATIDHISNRYDLDRQEAYAICSVASDLRIHELVDAPNWVVGAFLPESIFEGRELMATEAAPRPGQQAGLRRELRFWETIALSIGIMAPTAAMALNGVGVAANVGRAVPLAMIVATIGVLLVSFAFVRLSRHYAHAGSVYAFSGATLGPRAGFFSGWALFGTYLAFTCASCCEVGLFFPAFLNGAGIWSGTEWIGFALAAAAIISLIAYLEIKITTRALLSIETISVSLILILMIVIFLKLAGVGTTPPNAGFSTDVFHLPSGTSRSAFGLGIVLCFLSYGGFEGAAALGEETNNPRLEIPKAIRTAVLAAGVFYTLCFMAQSWGFGTDAAGVSAFASSSTPLGDLANTYIGSWMSNLIDLGAAVSAFASALGTATGASRILFAMGRDGFGPHRLGTSSRRTGRTGHGTGRRDDGRRRLDDRPAGQRDERRQRLLLPGHDRRAQHDHRLHRDQHRRDQAVRDRPRRTQGGSW